MITSTDLLAEMSAMRTERYDYQDRTRHLQAL